MTTTMTDTAVMFPAWMPAHSVAALKEGWEIFECSGSSYGPWQIQRLDDASDCPGSVQLDSDDDAWRLVLSGGQVHHRAALDFIKAHNAIEYEKLMVFADSEEISCPYVPGFSTGGVFGLPIASGVAQRLAARLSAPPCVELEADQQARHVFAAEINGLLNFSAPQAGTKVNGWFGGYGCRWCEASRAWFTVVPYSYASVADQIAELFRSGNVGSVTITHEGGVSEADGGRGLQVSAYV